MTPENKAQPTSEKIVKVSRSIGECDFCGKMGHMIRAYDAQIYEGNACPSCLLGGKASSHPVESSTMRPMVWVARGLLGEQPFARLLKVAESQSARRRLKKSVKRKKRKP